MPRLDTGALYDKAISTVFAGLYDNKSRPNVLDFDKDYVEEVIRKLVQTKKLRKHIKNIPDIKYTYDARRNFPPEITRFGNWAIVGRGKSKYSFVKLPHRNLIKVPDDLGHLPVPIVVRDKTPLLVSKVLGNDEQALLARIRYSSLLDAFTNLRTHLVQSHQRTTVSAGQVEIDDIYVGEDKNGKGFVLPISAKGGGRDCLSYSQALNLNLYASEKTAYSGLQRRPIGITRSEDGTIYLVEFSEELDITKISISRIACYVFR